jgi:hypothetical protein
MATALRNPQTRLTLLAGEMRGSVERTGHHAHQKLPHGLEIVMQRTEGRWRLAMAREGVWPSDVEVEVCRHAFHVPDGSLELRKRHLRRHPKTGRQFIYSVVEVYWMER